MKNSLESDVKILDDSLILPCWWADNFLALNKAQTHLFFQPDMLKHFRLTPTFHKRDMWFLPFFINHLQKSLFLREQDFSLDYEKSFFGSVETLSHEKKSSLLRFLHSIGSMKILVDDVDGMQAFPLFKSETRSIKDFSCFLKFKFSNPYIEELFLGYPNPYGFLFEEEKKFPFSSFHFLKNNPVMMKKSLWFDLTTVEQLLLWNFKKKNVVSESLVGVENEGEIDFRELFQGVFFRPSEKISNFARKLKVAKKFFEKLRSHGELETVSDQFFALGKDEGALKFVFKLSRNVSSDLHKYQAFINSYYFQKNKDVIKTKNFYERVKLFLDGSYPDDLNQKLKEAIDFIEKDSKASQRTIFLKGGKILSIPYLFLEYIIRSYARDEKKIPEDLKNLPCLFFLERSTLTQADYTQFVESFSHDDMCLAALSHIPFATLVGTDIIRKSITMKEPAFSTSAIKEKHSEKPDAEKKEISRSSIMDGLNKIKKSSSEQYRSLTDSYVSSLDENSRFLLLSVKKKMQPNLFEEHLDRRLIDYVMTNPKKYAPLVAPSLNLN